MATLVSKTSNASSIGGYSGAYTFKLEVIENSTSVTNNTSSITVNHYVKGNSSFYYEDFWTPESTITVSGSVKKTTSVSSTSTSWKKIGTWTGNIAHNSDGTKSVSISVNYEPNISGYSYLPTSNTISATVTLTTIPRASSITVPTSVTIGNTCAVTINRVSTSFTHTLVYSCGEWSVSRTGKTTSDSYTIPMEVCNQITTSTSKSMTITCKTYNGSTLIGSTSKNVTLNVPSSVVPTVDDFLINEAVSGLATQFGAYVRGKSKITVDVSGSGTYGAGISSYKIKIGSTTYNSYTATSGILYNSSYSIVATVTDSRGRSASSTKTITTVEYSAPTSSISVARCTSDGTLNDDGTYAKITYSYNISSVGNKNTKSCVIQYLNGSTWTNLESLTDYSANSSAVKGTFSTDNPYQFRIVAADYFVSSTSYANLPTAFTLINFNAIGRGLCIGGVSQDDTFEVNLPVKLNANLTGQNIVGTWLQSTEASNLDSNSGKIAVLDSSGMVYYRTPSQILSDIGIGNIDISSKVSTSWNTTMFSTTLSTCFYSPLLDMVYLKTGITVLEGKTLTAGTEYTVISINDYQVRNAWYPISVYASKKANAVVKRDSDGLTRVYIKPLENIGADYLISVAGWYKL